jgi:uncharacterized protein (TIGR02147 family)
VDGRTLLLTELTARKSRNSSYSLRAFARDLSVSPAALSQYLSRKRELSRKNSQSIVEKLKLSPIETAIMLTGKESRTRETVARELMDEDTFRMISDWLSLAIMNLARLADTRARADWIAIRLGVAEDDVEIVIGRLQRLGLVAVRKGRLVRTSRPFATTQDIPSAAIKRFHSSILEKARDSLLETPIDERDITAIVMPTNEKKLEEAKRIIRKMRHKIAELVADETAEEVYVLSVQLFPLTKRKPNRRGAE